MNPIIKKYFNILTINDINKFALKNDIILSKQELEILYTNLKNNMEEIIQNSENVFLKLRDKLTNENYNKIHRLFDDYKKKYQNYL